ncbi:thioesterase [Paenibacillus albidus]|uniref:Medium/long-chain acyl-CoA thioesterase YigI n=1 Tax=Paenibacillus albidus TaxID=2041023 RepID=A0A917CKJ7_9BACL|nr:PaaI family thioesterase [Paenibacillus albidus]MBT2289430.1 PaaI family thioesterase [Paenibacillus albidus]GGF91690.1 thioesterase [Paenibacillus albidus]
MKDAINREQIEALLRSSAYHRFLDVQVDELSEESITISLPGNALFVTGDAEYIHGGIIATLIDIAGYFAVHRKVNLPTPTVDLQINYLRPAAPGILRAKASVVKLGRSVSLADILVTDHAGKEVAVGRGLFSSKQ